MSNFHIPVMAKEVVEYLNPTAGKIIVDCTLGGGGHAQAILKSLTPYPPLPQGEGELKGVRVIAFDQDLDAIEEARAKLAQYPDAQYIHDNFSNIDKGIKKPVDGFLFDLGVSSHQIDAENRGFSFRADAPLDMRMDKNQKLSAADIVNGYAKEELFRIFTEYGEERFANRVSNAIGEARAANEIKTTFQLKEIIEKAIPTWRKRESVARIFQALRIEVNHELDNLKKGLAGAVQKLNPAGRVVVISYHSLEDRIVKWFFREKEKSGILKIITKRPIVPQENEIAENPRAKSAKLRCAEKI